MKSRKDKLLVLDGDTIRIQTTVEADGVRTRVLHGVPYITTTPDDIRLGCIRITMPVFEELIRLVRKQKLAGDVTVIHQVGNYGEPDGCAKPQPVKRTWHQAKHWREIREQE